jgi:hypothetical protein
MIALDNPDFILEEISAYKSRYVEIPCENNNPKIQLLLGFAVLHQLDFSIFLIRQTRMSVLQKISLISSPHYPFGNEFFI